MKTDLFSENKLLQQMEYDLHKVVLSSYPTIINLPVADRCNLRCFMCSISASNDNYKILLTSDAYGRVEAVFPYLETLELEGAEVFTAREGSGGIIDKIITSSESHPNLKLAALSNGQLINEIRAEKVVSKFSVLNVSIDTPDPEVYESIRIGGKFDVLIQNLHRINEIKSARGRAPHDAPRVQFSAIVMNRTYQDLESLVHLIHELGGVYFSFQPLRQEISDEQWQSINHEDIFQDRDKVIHFLEIVKKVKETAAGYGITVLDRTKTYARRFHPDLIDRDEATAKQTSASPPPVKSSDNKRPVCRFAWRNLFIRPNGEVAFSCCSRRTIGNINKQSIYEIYNSEEAIDERRNFLKGDYRNCNINCQMSYSFVGTKLED